MIARWDNPASVRFRKYATGSHAMLALMHVQTGRTPHDVVWKRGNASLRRYRQWGGEVGSPVLIVYPPILKPYILDLVPGASLVEHLIAHGHPLYLLQLGDDRGDDGGETLDDYVVDYLPAAVEEVVSREQVAQVTVLGHCMGGTLAAIHVALTEDERVARLVLLAAPIDFAPADPGPFGLWTLWTRAKAYDADLLARLPAALPMPRVSAPAPFLRVAAPEALEAWLGVCAWVDDPVAFPSAALAQWLRDFYQHNRLAKAQLDIGGQRVDLSRITCPVLTVAGARDSVTPLVQATAAAHLIGAPDNTVLRVDAGHLGMVVGPPARTEVWPAISDWIAARSR